MSTLRGATKRFVSEAFAMETDDCIIWPYGLHPKGYPTAQDKNGVYKPHRRICEMANGPAPSAKHHAAHSCGTRNCINKRHLSWKTPKENEADKHIHGRAGYLQNREKRRKLSGDDVRVIRQRSAAGEAAFSISRDYPITHRAIAKIASRETYRDID